MRLGGFGLLAVSVLGLALMLGTRARCPFLAAIAAYAAAHGELCRALRAPVPTSPSTGGAELHLPMPGLVAGALWQLTLPSTSGVLKTGSIGLGLIFAAIVAVIPNTAGLRYCPICGPWWLTRIILHAHIMVLFEVAHRSCRPHSASIAWSDLVAWEAVAAERTLRSTVSATGSVPMMIRGLSFGALLLELAKAGCQRIMPAMVPSGLPRHQVGIGT